MSTTTSTLDPDELAHLEEQRDFLLRSLADLERERDAGDLDDHDFETLRDDYTARAAEVLRAIDERRAAFADARRPRSLGRTIAWIGGVALFALVAGVVAANAMGARKAGESASGGITVKESTSQRANACIPKIQTDAQAASTCFEKIIKEDPSNAVALTWSAWQLSLSAPSMQEPDKTTAQAYAALRLEKAVKADPNYSYARAFRAIVAYRNGRYQDAATFLADFKAHNPSAQAAQVIDQMGLTANIDKALADQATSTTTSPGQTTSTTATTAPN